MPQMAPLNWLNLFIWMILIVMMIMLTIYFSLILNIKKKELKNKIKNNWKW